MKRNDNFSDLLLFGLVLYLEHSFGVNQQYCIKSNTVVYEQDKKLSVESTISYHMANVERQYGYRHRF
jgi:hypothetical protein